MTGALGHAPAGTWHALAVVLALFAVATAVNLQLPLYAAYGEAAGYGQGLRAVAFASYVVGLIPILAFLGGLSDVLGRKTAVQAGLAMAIAATVLMQVQPTVQALMVARVLQGASVAVAASACTAYLAELLPSARAAAQAASATALTTAVGFGGGALATSLCRSLPGGQGLQPPSACCSRCWEWPPSRPRQGASPLETTPLGWCACPASPPARRSSPSPQRPPGRSRG